MEARKIAVDASMALTDCEPRRRCRLHPPSRLYLAGARDPKRLTFKGLQAVGLS